MQRGQERLGFVASEFFRRRAYRVLEIRSAGGANL